MKGMSGQTNVEIDVHLEDTGAPSSMAREIREGLLSSPKSLPSKYFYDERGSRLFERITELPEYYLTRAELALLERDADEIARLTGFEELVELGSGAAKKTRVLIEAGLRRGRLRRYVPVEVSQEIAERSAHARAAEYPELDVHAVVGDFERHLGRLPDGGGRLIAFLGSTIGNFPRVEAVDFLSKIRRLMADDDWFLLGTDLVKEHERLEAAYNDNQGVTAEFNLNILHVINRHLDGDFEVSQFEHVSFYDGRKARIESYLRSRRDQSVRLAEIDLEVEFERGEMMRTEVSCKYTRDSVETMLAEAGLDLRHWLTDEQDTFALSLARLDDAPVH